MRTHQIPSALISLFFFLPILTDAISIDCSNIVVDKKRFNLNALDGPHSLYKVQEISPIVTNTTFTIDVCRPLKKTKGVPKDQECPNGSRVCAIKRVVNTVEKNKPLIDAIIPIAGEFLHSEGGSLDPKWTRFKSSASNSDRKKEGLRLEMHGGSYEKESQKAIVEFLCPRKAGDDVKRRGEVLTLDDDDEDDDHSGEVVDDDEGGTLKYISWSIEGGAKVLRLEWKTEHACEDSSGSGNSSSSKHWGFFTWFIIIVFLGIAAYLIFGSWLNYNRLGTRGFDAVPHADTIRDLPYLFRDWMRRVVDTVQGGHSRAGYSAV